MTRLPSTLFGTADRCWRQRIGRSTLYVLIGKGEIEVIKMGAATLVLTASLRSLVERLRSPDAKQASGAL